MGAAIVALLLALGFFWLTTDLPTPEHLRARAALGSTRILDRHGQLLYEVPDPLSGWQRPVRLDMIPLALRQATVAVEDASFYQNPGIDARGILRAAWTDLRSGALVAGGSTITQQIARGFLIDPDLARRQSVERKLREATLALKLTASYSKGEILELYLNQTYYGGMAFGVEAAARRYFGKPARDLDLAECALLAGLPQAPSRSFPRATMKHVGASRSFPRATMKHVGVSQSFPRATMKHVGASQSFPRATIKHVGASRSFRQASCGTSPGAELRVRRHSLRRAQYPFAPGGERIAKLREPARGTCALRAYLHEQIEGRLTRKGQGGCHCGGSSAPDARPRVDKLTQRAMRSRPSRSGAVAEGRDA